MTKADEFEPHPIVAEVFSELDRLASGEQAEPSERMARLIRRIVDGPTAEELAELEG